MSVSWMEKEQHLPLPGTVALLGAGPGDPGLMTLRAASRLRQADVVVYDRLVGFDLVDWTKPDAELICVGKQSNYHPIPQQEINAILVAKAKEGKRVVRLKGGDPFVFGRGGEEAEALLDAGVSWELVSGVSSAIAVPAAVGIPVTHREHCTSLHIVTGHLRADRSGQEPNFEALAKVGGTLVFLMGVKNLSQITQELLRHGLSPQTPAAIVSQGFSPQQVVLRTTLSNVVADALEARIQAPAILVVGSVAGLQLSGSSC